MKTLALMTALAWVALQSAAQNPPQDPEPGGIVEGFVRRAETGEAIENAAVRLEWFNSGAFFSGDEIRARESRTDENGRFTFTDVPARQYRVVARREGYFAANGAADDHGNLRDFTRIGIEVAARQHLDNLIVPLVPGGALSGRIVDAEGAPVAGASVGLSQPAYTETGRASSINKGKSTTNDLGEYRISGVAPGKYSLTASYRPVRADIHSEVYFPGTFNETAASRVTVRAGAESIGMDFAFPPPPETPLFTISGTVTGGPPELAGKPVIRFYLVSHRDSPPFRRWMQNVAYDRSHGRFQIRGLPAGTYDLYPWLLDENQRLYTVRIPLEIRGRSIENLTAVVQAAPDLRIHVVLDGELPDRDRTLAQSVEAASPYLYSTEESIARNLPEQDITIDPKTGDGAIRSVPPGTYILRFFQPGWFYIVDVRQSGESVLDGFTVGSAIPEPLEIVLGARFGDVEGVVEDAQHDAVPGARIALVPEPSHRQNPDRYATAAADDYGAFNFNSVTPGKYTLFAWTAVPYLAWMNADFMTTYENQGAHLRVEGGEATSAVVTVITRENP